MKATYVWCTVHWRSIMNVISVLRPATEPSMKTLLNLVMGLSKHLECTGHLYWMNLTMVSSLIRASDCRWRNIMEERESLIVHNYTFEVPVLLTVTLSSNSLLLFTAFLWFTYLSWCGIQFVYYGSHIIGLARQ